MPFLSN